MDTSVGQRIGSGAPHADARVRKAVARIELGQKLRARREQLPGEHSKTAVARMVGWTPQFYGEIENGTKSSDDITAWIRLAACLQLAPRRLLEEVWETREGFSLSLPPMGDSQREALLDIVMARYGGDLKELP